MKSRFDGLTSHSDRRNLAYFRSSGAIGILLSLLAISTLQSTTNRHESAADLLAMEIGDFEPVRIKELAVVSLPPQVADRTAPTRHTSAPHDEFAFGPYETFEPTGY